MGNCGIYFLGGGLWKEKGTEKKASESPHPEMDRGRGVSWYELGSQESGRCVRKPGEGRRVFQK